MAMTNSATTANSSEATNSPNGRKSVTRPKSSPVKRSKPPSDLKTKNGRRPISASNVPHDRNSLYVGGTCRGSRTKSGRIRSGRNSSDKERKDAAEEDFVGAAVTDDGGLAALSEEAQGRVRSELAKARSSGRVALKEAELRCPLPDAIFDPGASAATEEDNEHDTAFGAEFIISLDLSDNDLSAPAEAQENSPRGPKGSHEEGRAGLLYRAQTPPTSNRSVAAPAEPSPSQAPPAAVLDARIGRFTALRTLRAKRCRLTELPWLILQQELTCLLILDVAGNDLRAFRLECMPPSLSTLDISRNQISSLTAAQHSGAGNDRTIHLPNLTHFDANSNRLTRLPSNIYAPILQHLFLSQNKLEVLSSHPATPPPPLSALSEKPIHHTESRSLLDSCQTTLQTLYAPENCLQICPDLHRHSSLTAVDLRTNKLSSPPKIHGNLIKLNLDYNRIDTLEGLYPILETNPTAKLVHQSTTSSSTLPSIYQSNIQNGWYRAKMKEIRLTSNKLTHSLDDATLSIMTQLTKLDVSHNELDQLPTVLGYLPDLRIVNVDGNPLRKVRSAVKYMNDGTVDTELLKSNLRMKGLPPPGPGYLRHGDHGNGGEKDNASVAGKLGGHEQLAPPVGKTHVRNCRHDERKYNVDGIKLILALSVVHGKGSHNETNFV